MDAAVSNQTSMTMNLPPILLLFGLSWTVLLLMVLMFGVYTRWRAERSIARLLPQVSTNRSAVLIRPCAGDEPGLSDCLISVIHAKRSMPLQVIFGVDGSDDSAIPVIRDAMAILGENGLQSNLVVAPTIGPNPKVSILAGCMKTIEPEVDIVISADSNSDLSGYDLDQMVSVLNSDSEIGAVWAPPRLKETSLDSGWGSRIQRAVLHYSWHSFGLLSAIDPRGMVGKLFALKRDALNRIGGIAALVHYLGEDMQLGRLLRRRGFKTKGLPHSVRTVAAPMAIRVSLARFVRWTMVIKAQRQALLLSYPLLFFNFITTALLALLVAPVVPEPALLVIVFAATVRVSVGITAARMLGVRIRFIEAVTLPFVADAVLCSAFFKALFLRQIEWRGRAFTFRPSGELQGRT